MEKCCSPLCLHENGRQLQLASLTFQMFSIVLNNLFTSSMTCTSPCSLCPAPPASPSHPNQAPGISSLTFLCSKGRTQHHKKVLSSILLQPIEGSLKLSTPLSSDEVEIKIVEESTQEHSDWIKAHGEGVYEIELVVDQTWADIHKGRKLQEEWIGEFLEPSRR